MPDKDLIREVDFLKWPDEQQRLYTFRLLQQVSIDIKQMSALRCGVNTVASFIGGIMGGIIAAGAQLKFRLFQ